MFIFLLACAADWEPESTPLQVQAWAPTTEAPGLADTPLHVAFNAPLRAGSLDNLAVYDADGEWVVVSAEAEAGRPTLWVEAEEGWVPGQSYVLELYPGLEGQDGELLGSEVTVDFGILDPPIGDQE